MTVSIEQTIAATFQYLEPVMSRAIEIAPVADPLQLVQLLPESPPPAKRLMLAELVKLDMTKAAQEGQIRTLAFYAPALASFFQDEQLPLDLVLEEIQLLRASGQQPDIAQYKTRYPYLASVLGELLTRTDRTQAGRLIEKAPTFEDGSKIEDFEILRTLGRGSFASVYLARQVSMQRLVALKVSQRGSDEPIALSQLDHPNIVRVYDQRRITEPVAVLLYMQYMPGGTLAEVISATAGLPAESLSGKAILQSIDQALLAAGQPPPESSPTRAYLAGLDWPSAVAWIGVQLAEGLAAAHERGIMHRDVKPANVLLSADGSPKLADFNVSYGGTAGCAGAAVHFGGSLAYMSPEQLEVANPAVKRRPDELDSRSDLYSLAIVLWELWQGHRPVDPSNLISSWHEAVAQQIEMRRTPPKLVRAPETAAARVLERTLRETLRYDRELRPRTSQELAGRLRLALNERAAALFEPAEGSLYAQVRRWPVLLTTALIIFVPNGLAGALNYQYNLASMQAGYSELESLFVTVSVWVNCIVFPLGAVILILFAEPLRRALRAALAGHSATEAGLDAAWNLGHRAAMIGGFLWFVAGITFPLVLRWLDPRFDFLGVLEFFLSLVICGGIAWIYPFFGISLVASEIYYPALVAPTMVDARFPQRARQLKRRSVIYLASAAAIPLFALALLAGRQTLGMADASESLFLLVITVLTGVALVFAFQVYQRLNETIAELRSILVDTIGASSRIDEGRGL